MTRTCSRCAKPFERAYRRASVCLPCALEALAAGGRAMSKVNRAVKRGDLPAVRTLKCVDCGEQARDYDHRDYSKPLDVVPVCRRCNQLRGPAAWPVAYAA